MKMIDPSSLGQVLSPENVTTLMASQSAKAHFQYKIQKQSIVKKKSKPKFSQNFTWVNQNRDAYSVRINVRLNARDQIISRIQHVRSRFEK